ncbi:MAG: UDP-N-acetylmuramoyl-tripeptide--D-alanyl-D-alanine ligase [Clostridiales bacterium]|nr:UDP-N-acetylmuramoyl-tripeptide--D-alanyl-D-alanine ligase [Clostridiales bacterium]
MLAIPAAVLLLLAFAADCTVLILRTVHMLQLNSYRPERYVGWMKSHRDELVKTYGWLLIAVMAVGAYLLAPTDWVIRVVCAALFIIHLILNWPPRAKKPLVFTARVRRLLITHGLLLLLVGGAVALTGFNRLGTAALFLWAALIPLATLLALMINAPLEAAINRHYIRDAQSRLASLPNLVVIGVTGSYGKTSTKNFLAALLSVKYNVLMTPESFNTTLGVVRTIRERLTPAHQVFIAEMGAKNVGDIREICELVHPRYGMITAIGEQHLETFRSLDNIVRTKFELADALPAGGLILLNTDNEAIRRRLQEPPSSRVVTYGLEQADYTAGALTVDSRGSSFTVTGPGGEQARFTTRLLGAHNIQNITGSIAMACSLGIPLQELIYPVKTLRPVEHRLQLLPNGYIDDAYNANPAGFRAALDVLAGFEGQRILVTPGMVELGERQEALNRELGGYAASRCDIAVLVGEKQAPPLKEGLLAAGFDEERLYVAPHLQDALNYINALPAEGPRTVLLENDLPDNF